jgi:hypothetical protein
LVFKIESYLESKVASENKETNKASASDYLTKHVPSLVLKMIGFLLAINNPTTERKVFYGRTDALKIKLYSSNIYYWTLVREIVEDARCVILTERTM